MPDSPRTERKVSGAAVKAIRKLQKITQDDLATVIDIDPGFLSRIERGERGASPAVIVRLANALEVDINAISYIATVYVIADSEDAA